MRSRTIPALGLGVAALATAVITAGSANASGHTASAVAHGKAGTVAAAKGKACYSLTTNDTGVGIASQTASDDPTIDSAGAADFKVKTTCTVGTVQSTGVYYNGSGPAASVNVTFYKNTKGQPGAIVKVEKNLKYTDGTGTGSLGVKFKKPLTLKKGSYFVSVTANMDFGAGGQWGWELSSDTNGAVDQWQNQGGAFGVCPSWGDVLTCTGFGNDFMVSLTK